MTFLLRAGLGSGPKKSNVSQNHVGRPIHALSDWCRDGMSPYFFGAGLVTVDATVGPACLCDF